MTDLAAPPARVVDVRAVEEMDRRCRLARDEQRRVIDRLLAGRPGRTLDDEFLRQQGELVELRARVERVMDLLVGRRGSPVARQVVRILGDAEGV